MSEQTPGPWKWLPFFVEDLEYAAGGYTGYDLVPADFDGIGDGDSIVSHSSDWEPKTADMDLIAAAPDLLAAADALCARYIRDIRQTSAMDAEWTALHSAIAKAKGETHA